MVDLFSRVVADQLTLVKSLLAITLVSSGSNGHSKFIPTNSRDGQWTMYLDHRITAPEIPARDTSY